MKKLVIAAAVLGAFTGTAQAQSSVTLFGVVDTGITHISSNNVPVEGVPGATQSANRTFQSDSAINSDRLGFRGTEDLGGGLKAGFWLEAGFSPESGAGSATSLGNGAAAATTTGGGGLTFNRRSTVSLIGDRWGEIRLGRDYVPTFWNSANTDPFGYNGIAEVASYFILPQGAQGPAAVRASNGYSYLTPNTLGGFFLQATYAMGQLGSNAAPGTKDDGQYSGVNVGYQNGPIYIGIATSYTSLHETGVALGANPLAPVNTVIVDELGQGGVHTTNVGGSYDFGVVKADLFYQTSTENQGQAFNPNAIAPTGMIGGRYTTDIWSAGAVVPLGQGEFRFNYAHAKGSDFFAGNSSNMFGVGYIYNLSKRTALYGIYAHMTNSGEIYTFELNGYGPGPGPGGTTNGVSLGLRTSF